MSEKELVKTQTGVIPADLDLEAMAREDFADDTADDIVIPFITLLQGLSPEVEAGVGRPGQWCNKMTDEAYDADEGFLFIAVAKRHYFNEWQPRTEGGGFLGQHEVDSPLVTEAIARGTLGSYRTSEGMELVDTHYLYGVVCSEEHALMPAAISFKSTAIRPLRNWNSRITYYRDPETRKRAPMMLFLNRFVSEQKENKKGKYYVPKIEPYDSRGLAFSRLESDDERFVAAWEIREMVRKGRAKVDPNRENADAISDADRARMEAEDADAFG